MTYISLTSTPYFEQECDALFFKALILPFMIGNTKQFFYNQLNENNDGIIILCRLEVKGEEMHVANRKKNNS